MKDIQVRWEEVGTLFSIESVSQLSENRKGVYLWVFNGTPNRIIYVGTGLGEGGLYDRLNLERKEMIMGQHYFFKLDTDMDPYKVYLTKSVEDIKKSVIDGVFWYPNNKLKVKSTLDKAEVEEFQKRVNIIITDLEPRQADLYNNMAKTLETQIQMIFLYNCKIKYYRKYGLQSWLGKPERISIKDFDAKWQELKKYNYKFLNNVGKILSKDYQTSDFFNTITPRQFLKKVREDPDTSYNECQ